MNGHRKPAFNAELLQCVTNQFADVDNGSDGEWFPSKRKIKPNLGVRIGQLQGRVNYVLRGLVGDGYWGVAAIS